MDKIETLHSAPFVSIVTPVYNRCDMLRACIDSVLIQGIDDFEMLLVDDASTEDTRSILEEYAMAYPEQIRYHLCETNQGPSVARNIALDMAKGKYITFLDSDDRLAAGFLQSAKNLAERYDVDLLSYGYEIYTLDGQLVVRGKHAETDGKPNRVGLYTNPNIARFFRRSIIEKYHFRYPENKLCEDALWTLMTISTARTIQVVPEIGYLNTDHGGSLSRNREYYSKLSIGLLPLADFDKLQRDLESVVEDQALFDYFCTSFTMLCCFLWSNRGPFSGLSLVIDALYPSQERILKRKGKNPYLRFSAGNQKSFKKYVRPILHLAVVACSWLFRLHLVRPVAMMYNFFSRLRHGELFSKKGNHVS